ncbi:MAG TPA: prepilin-type N-terminal cleavage/methylation domain-containing protein [Gallionella sp.]|nr:prepilin-type N-terminal cleavage/methylation domain-containing protein [Gallionella sp.]
MCTRHNRQSGFTLVEMIMVIVITGIIGGIVAVFLKAPIQQYMDVARRAELTDIADTALHRMVRDVRTAVPNSVRVTGVAPNFNIEFLPTKTGGRYRAFAAGGAGGCGGAGDELAFAPAPADTCFEVIGSPIAVAANDYIVVGSTQSDAVPPYDTSATGVLRQATAVGAVGAVQNITMAGAASLPAFAQLDSQRFQVVDGIQQAVTFACETVGTSAAGDGTGKLMRYWGYGFTHTLGATKALLADKVSACTIDYDVTNQRFGLLAVRLTLTSGGESVSLYNEIHVNNAP